MGGAGGPCACGGCVTDVLPRAASIAASAAATAGVPSTQCRAPTHPAPQVWLRAVKYRLVTDDAEGARKTLDRSLQSLPQFEHIRMISQTGLLEFKLGDAGVDGWEGGPQMGKFVGGGC